MPFFEEVRKTVAEYIKTDVDRFLVRQCHHIEIDNITQLTEAHAGEFAKWVRISAALLIGEEQAEELKQKILSLAGQ